MSNIDINCQMPPAAHSALRFFSFGCGVSRSPQRRRIQDGDAVLAARAVGDEDLVVGDSESPRPRDLEQRRGGEQCAVVLAQP